MPSTGVEVDLFGVSCSTGVPSGDGAVWLVTAVTGWDAPDLRAAQVAPTGRHGAVSLANFYGGRVLTVTGHVFADNDDDAWDAYYRVAGSMPAINDAGQIVVYESPPKALTVEQAGPPRIDAPVEGSFEFQLSLLAAFPFKTSPTANTPVTLASGGSGTLLNAGTFSAYPVVTATSSGTVDLVIGGRHFITLSVASGTVIDMWERTIRDGSGADVSPWPKDPASEWLSVPAGGASAQQLGTAGLSVVTFDTFA